jgi:hypothetical protein
MDIFHVLIEIFHVFMEIFQVLIEIFHVLMEIFQFYEIKKSVLYGRGGSCTRVFS